MALDIVVCSLECWDDVWRRNQYLADRVLVERSDARILFVEPPQDTWRRKFEGPSRWRTSPPVPVGDTNRLWKLAPLKPLPRVLGPIADLSLRRQVGRATAQLDFRDPVVWLNDLNWMSLVESTGWNSIYDITDDWVVESTVPRRVRERRTALERHALAQCEEVVVCSTTLERRKGARRSVWLIPNGVDPGVMTGPRSRPDDLPASPTAVYVGTLHEERIDVDLVADLAETAAAAVVMIGPNALSQAASSRLRDLGVHLLGPRPHTLVPAYLQHADVVVVPHLINDFTESLDPIKAYECLAVGTPTISTAVAGFRGLTEPVAVVERGDFVSKTAATLAYPPARKPTLPRDATWVARGRRFLEALERASSSTAGSPADIG